MSVLPQAGSRADSAAVFPSSVHQWLASRQARFIILGIAACLSLPAYFARTPDIGLDPSWSLSLQLAAAEGRIFGQEFVFTYGPLGYLLIHAPVSKASLLLYDVFILGSLLGIYARLLPQRPRPLYALTLIALAMVTKASLLSAPATLLFTILCNWLWRLWDHGDVLAVLGSLAAAVLGFFGKVNYGLVIVFLIPAYVAGLMIIRRDRRVAGIVFLVSFLLLVELGATIWHVTLPGYLRSGVEIITGFNEAMFIPPAYSLLVFELACMLVLAMVAAAFLGSRRVPWRGQAMLLPLIGLAVLVMFKNAFARSDEGHNPAFYAALPLLLAVWCVAWPNAGGVRALLLMSLIYPAALMTTNTQFFSRVELFTTLPVLYFRQVAAVPWREHSSHLRQSLLAHYPEAVLPNNIRQIVGEASVDVMPWETSIAVISGMNLKQRPVPASYNAYTLWLDALNARFLSSSNAPTYLFYHYGQCATIDERPAAWDESVSKRALMANYRLISEFPLPMRVWHTQKLEPGAVFLLKHESNVRRFIPVATNAVSVGWDQPLMVPPTTNLLFLTLDVSRTALGKFRSLVLSPSILRVTFGFEDGSSSDNRAVLPILKTGVLINRRVESEAETRNWLEAAPARNMGVSWIRFKSSSSLAIKFPLTGAIVEYRLAETDGATSRKE